jgi:cell wall assembly regulator SMI1
MRHDGLPELQQAQVAAKIEASYKQHDGSNGKSLANGTLLSWPWRCFRVFHDMEVLMGES